MKLKEIWHSAIVSRRLSKLDVSTLHSLAAKELPVIVSFTSIPSRFHLNHLTVRSILSGSVLPEKIVLWLHESHEGKLPNSLTSLVGPRFSIQFVPQDSPHLKLVRSLQAFPDKVVVTCDDDLLYESDWLRSLYDDHLKYPNEIIAHECRSIVYDDKGSVLPYSYWYRETLPGASYDALMPLGFGGVLYPQNCFHSDVCDESRYLQLTPKADDLWFKMMSFLHGTRSRLASKPCTTPTKILNSQTVNLRDSNISQDGNRRQWHALAEFYGIHPFAAFSVDEQGESDSHQCSEVPIDAVITWVDGEDPKHAEKLKNYLIEQGIERPASAPATRYNDRGEISFCVASILKHAPWIRTIFILTDQQTPNLMQWIERTPFSDRVKIIDHTEVFEGHDQHLPTFNTRSISAALWRIPGLAEHFLYLNDDFFFIKNTKPTDFFVGDKVVLRGHWSRWASLENWVKKRKSDWQSLLGKTKQSSRPGFKQAQRFSASLAGFSNRWFKLEHNPHPIRKSRLQHFAEGNAELFDRQLSHRFRSEEQYLLESLSAHLELAAGNAIVDNTLHAFQLTPEKHRRKQIKWKLKAAQKDKTAAFACIQNIDKTTARSEELIFTWLKNQIGTLIAKNKT